MVVTVKRVGSTIQAALAAEGCVNPHAEGGGRQIIWEIDDTFCGSVILAERSPRDVWPALSVILVPLAELARRLQDIETDGAADNGGLVSSPVAEQLREIVAGRVWSRETDADTERIAADVVQWGLPWVIGHASIDCFTSTLSGMVNEQSAIEYALLLESQGRSGVAAYERWLMAEPRHEAVKARGEARLAFLRTLADHS